jgi:hypothetical protein
MIAEAEHIAAQARTRGWKRQLNEKKGFGNEREEGFWKRT